MKRKIIIVISIILTLILIGFLCFLIFKPETEEQKETRELKEKISKSKEDLDNFLDEKDKELQNKLNSLNEGYDVPTKSYFSSPENMKLKSDLEQKGYKFKTVTIKNENSTYFSNDNYSISCIIDINTNNFINISFWNKKLQGDACNILDISKNSTEEKQEQYNSYLQWIKENNLTLEQLKNVLLDHYLNNK